MARDRAARPEAKALRLFVAIELPAEAQDAVEAAIAPWREAFPRARWVPAANRHVTVKFLGQTWPRLRGWVEERVADAARSAVAFETSLTELGAFPSARRARVLWVGLDDRPGRMAEVALGLDVALAEEFRPETRAFTPHLTVARSDPPLELPPDYATTAVAPVRFRVDHVTLFRSHLRRPAPRYEPLATFPFGA
jgi:RNA 2',3'-cyclic 3'-phosphodiesterase